MDREIRSAKTKLHLTVESPGKISLAMSNTNEVESNTHDDVQPMRHRRRTTSFKAKRPCDQRRPSLPLFSKFYTKPKCVRKSVLQRIGSRLAKLGDDLLKNKGKLNINNRSSEPLQRSNVSGHVSHDIKKCPRASIKHYAAELAILGDYLESLYSNDVPLMYSPSRYATLSANCSLLTTVLVALRNDNVVLIKESDLQALSSYCRVHRVKSISRKDR